MTNPPTIIRGPEVQRRIGLSRTTLYRLHTPGSSGFDKTFPRPIRIVANSVGWLEDEISAWISQRISASRQEKTA